MLSHNDHHDQHDQDHDHSQDRSSNLLSHNDLLLREDRSHRDVDDEALVVSFATGSDDITLESPPVNQSSIKSSKKVSATAVEFIASVSSKSIKSARSAVSKASVQSITDLIPDGGFGWVVAVSCFFVQFLVFGTVFSFGVYYPVYISAFHGTQASVAWIGSIGGFIMSTFGTVSGSLADRYGNDKIVGVGSLFIGLGMFLASFCSEMWQMYLTQGVITGIGYSLSFIPSISVVGQWFTEHRGLAVGIAVAGGGLGQFIISMITGSLLASYGWRTTIRIMALINFIGLMAASFGVKRLLPCTSSIRSAVSFELLNDSNVRFLCLTMLGNSLAMFMPYSVLPIYCQQQGLSTNQSVFILSIVGIASAVGRFSSGFAADYLGKIPMMQLASFVTGISTFSWMACKNFSSLLSYAIIFGFFGGGVISLVPSVAAEVAGVKQMGAVIGLVYTLTGVGILLSAPISGFLHDAYGNYYPSISVDAGFFMISTFFLLFIRRKKETSPAKIEKLETAKSKITANDLEEKEDNIV